MSRTFFTTRGAQRSLWLGVWAALLVGSPTTTSGADGRTLAEATAIRAESVATRNALQATVDLASTRDASYWTSLRESQMHVVKAYQLSLAAQWPIELGATREKANRAFVCTIRALARLDRTDRSLAPRFIRAVLAAEIAHLDANDKALAGVVPAVIAVDPAPAPAPIPPPNAIVDLVPGTGFAAATAQPAAIGTGRGADAKAIARWDVVPYQTFAGRLPVGVVAFHMAGIDRVEFSVNGGPWAAVTAMTPNPVTGIWEYNANLDASKLPDGQLEVRAVVYPKVGIPRVLAGPHDSSDRALVSGEYSLLVSANQTGTLSSPTRWVSPTGSDTTGDGTATAPFATIARAAADLQGTAGTVDGATIRLAEGDYVFPSLGTPLTTSRRWLTIAGSAPTNDKVRLTSAAGVRGLDTKLVHVRNLTVRVTELNDAGTAGFDRVWADGCVLEGTQPLDATRFFPLGEWTGGVYMTDCTVRNVKYPLYGQMLTRNVVVTDCGGDAVREPSGLLANCEIRNLVNLDDTHNDVIQFWDPYPRSGFENIIVYGLEAVHSITAQALFVQQYGTGVRYDNFAFVNYLTYAPYGAQWQNPGTHLLLWNVGILSPPEALALNKGGFMFCDVTSGPARATSVHDVSVRNSVFQRFNVLQTGTEPALSDATNWADNNHYLDVTSYTAVCPGTNATKEGSNATLFRDPVHGDFSPAAGSVLLNRVQAPLVPSDVSSRARRTPDAIGPLGVTQ